MSFVSLMVDSSSSLWSEKVVEPRSRLVRNRLKVKICTSISSWRWIVDAIGQDRRCTTRN